MRKEYPVVSIALYLVLSIASPGTGEEKGASAPRASDPDLIGPPAIPAASADPAAKAPPAAAPGADAAPLPASAPASGGTTRPAPAREPGKGPGTEPGAPLTKGPAPAGPAAGASTGTAPTPAAGARKVNFAPILPAKDYSPPVLFVEEPRYDFGDIFKGDVINHRFELENKGGSALVIQEIKPSCGCTVANPATMDRVISPGSKGGFELKLETSRLPAGRQQKYADISSNDPKQPKYRVFIQGKIDSLLKVEPEAPKIQSVKGQGQGATEITLHKNTQAETKVLGARSVSGRLLVDTKEVEPGSVWKVIVKTNYGPKDTQTYFSEQVQADLQIGERKMTQEIPVAVQIRDRIELTPRSLYFKRTDFQPLKDKGTPTVKTVDIKSALDDSHRFTITGMKVEDPDSVFKVTKETVKEGREYRLVVTIEKLPPSNDPRAQKSLKGNITLTTDDPNMPEINIRCIAFF